MWLADLPVVVTGTQGRRCVFAPRRFCERAKKNLVWATCLVLAGSMGASASKTNKFSWDLCWGGARGISEKPAKSMCRCKQCDSALAGPESDAVSAGGVGTALPGWEPLLSAALPAQLACPVQPGPWPHRGYLPTQTCFSKPLICTFPFEEGKIQCLCQSLPEMLKHFDWESILLVLVKMFHSSTSYFIDVLWWWKKLQCGCLGSTEICYLGWYVHIMF